jgi:hypothetical protein
VLEFNKRSERITDLLDTMGIEDRYGTEFQENKNEIQWLEKYKDKRVEMLV